MVEKVVMLQRGHVVAEDGIKNMAHFYGDVRGKAKTRATRVGSKTSGMNSHIRSWNKGIEIICDYNERDNKNIFEVYLTGGSNNSSNKRLISKFEEDLD